MGEPEGIEIEETAPAPPDRGVIGTIVNGRFHVHSLIAKGGMGCVYYATQTPLDRAVALKILDIRAHQVESKEDFKRRFLQEASILAKLQHPNIVTLLDYGQVEGVSENFFMAMEFLRGETLSHRFKTRGKLPVDECLRLARQVGRGLREAHKHGFVHRDLKPSNIMLVPEDDGEIVKVVDFGIGKAVHVEKADGEDLTREGLLLGTPRYMAPEQVKGEEVEARTDLYGLGIILFQALTGRLPFDAKTSVEMMLAHCTTPAPTIADVAPEESFPQNLVFLVHQLLQKPIEDRPTMEEYFQLLGDCEEELLGTTARNQKLAADAPPISLRRSRFDSSGRLPKRGLPSSGNLTVGSTPPDGTPSHGNLRALASGATAFTAAETITPRARRRAPFLVVALIALLGGAGLVATVFVLRLPAEASAGARPKAPVVETPTSFVLHLDSTPSGATVLENGREIGLTPLDLTMDHRAASTGLPRKFILRSAGFVLATHTQGDAPLGDVSVTVPLTAEAPPALPAPPPPRQPVLVTPPPPVKTSAPVRAPPPPDFEIRKNR